MKFSLEPKDIKAIAQYVGSAATPEEVQQIHDIIDLHPDAKEIKNAITVELLNMLLQGVTEQLEAKQEADLEEENDFEDEEDDYDYEDDYDFYFDSFDDEDDEDEEFDAQSAVLASLQSNQLAKAIAEQVKEPKAEADDLSSLIKAQAEPQLLAALIREQLEEMDHEADYEEERYSTVEEVLDEIVEEILEFDYNDQLEIPLPIAPDSIELMEHVFEFQFNQKARDRELGEEEYKNEYTAYLMTELASALVNRGYELAFEVQGGQVRPVLTW
ncbi:hypothetical protein [Cytobacillus oceanisediminis]|uniref:hypothetical protein n=1 Tax=Cytobacillus oceanisediminis TaxID=665099 RepID=UPI001FB3E77E|nr:hypothetical protein [Cytobacillus oceanisediminis]UOE58137.1 hypothetical protein IRB79_26895 [Cytobacillus oceanisediminis]